MGNNIGDNMLTTHELTELTTALKTSVDDEFTYGAIGTGTTAATVDDTSLESEVLRKARQETSTTTTSRTVSLWIASTEANASNITELGWLDESTGGNLKGRWVFDEIAKTSTYELWFDVNINFEVTQ